jgi:type II secretion system protein J
MSSHTEGKRWMAEGSGINGFTLLEVLIAMSILAVIMTIIFTSFSTAGRNVEQAEAVRDSTDLARTLIARLSTDIENAYVKAMNVPTIFSGKKVLPESGNDEIRHDELYLTTLTNWRRPDSKEMDLLEVGYYFRQKMDGTGFVLMRREKRELSRDVPALEGGVEYELTDRVRSLRYRYFYSTAVFDEWTNTTSAPGAVEIALVLDDGSSYVTRVSAGR